MAEWLPMRSTCWIDCPTGFTNLTIPGVLHRPLESTKIPTQKKLRKYRDIAEVNHYTLVPFVMESYGGMASHAVNLLDRLSNRLHQPHLPWSAASTTRVHEDSNPEETSQVPGHRRG